MNKILLEILGLSASHSQSGSCVLVLEETKGTRRLPIIIGMFEAQAIAIEMEKISSSRPMTHDLFKSFAISFDIDVHEIIISDLKKGVFFAKVICRQSDSKQFIELDARPSDAIAIGLSFNAPIYASDQIMNEAGIETSDLEEVENREYPPSIQPQDSDIVESQEPVNILRNISTEQLRILLQNAIDTEDYEKASKIRDELDNR